jgi:RNA polymerase sigma factor (sigma-70 family)
MHAPFRPRMASLVAPSDNWAGLMARAQDGDKAAYRALLTAITPYIRALARRALRDATDVDDVVQEVLLTLHQIRHTYDPSRPFAPWLATIARRRIVDRVRWNASHAAQKVAGAAALLAEAPSADHPQEDEEHNGLREAIGALPDRQRNAIELLKLRGLTLQEVSRQTGMSIGSLKAATHRALKTLRRLLSE